jgi:hypothetical protein
MGLAIRWCRRLLTLALLAAFVAAGLWWLGHVPYDPMAVYRPIPASASMVGRHLRLPARWEDLLDNPLALALMRAGGADAEAARALSADAESLRWFEKLAGREGTLAYLPGRYGVGGTWMAVTHLAGDSQKLRWQLSVFDVPGFERMEEFPRRPVWAVATPDLDPRLHLAIAFGEGVLLACLSENPYAISEALGAYDGSVARLVDQQPSFRRFAQGDDRMEPDRMWIRDETPFASMEAPGIVVDVSAVDAEGLSLRARTEGFAWVPPDADGALDFGALARRLGASPCAAGWMRRNVLEALAVQPWMHRHGQHAVRMALEAAGERIGVFLLDGEYGGRLAFGPMRTLGLAGLRVPTLLLATPSGDSAAADAAIQRILDASNARYRAAFVLRRSPSPDDAVQILESAGGNEWVDALARDDRPAYAVVDGWLLAASNADALQKLVRGEAALARDPAWAGRLRTRGGAVLWLDLARAGKVLRDAMATWTMAQMFFSSGSSDDLRPAFDEAKRWIDALVPLREARLVLGHAGGLTELSVDLGLSHAESTDRMAEP